MKFQNYKRFFTVLYFFVFFCIFLYCFFFILSHFVVLFFRSHGEAAEREDKRVGGDNGT